MASDPGTSATGDPVLESAVVHISQVNADNRIRGTEASNKSFYFTTSKGIKKLSTVEGLVRHTGGLKGLDTELEAIDATTASFVLPQDSQIGYRIVWGYKDDNNTLFLGTPSQRVTKSLSVQELLVADFNAILSKLDTAAPISGADALSDTDYATTIGSLSSTSTAAAINAKLKSLCAKIELDLAYVNPTIAKYGRSAAFTNSVASPTVITSTAHQLTTGDKITIINSTSTPSLDGEHTITVTGANTFTVPVNVTVAGAGTWISGIARSYPTPTGNTTADFLDQQEFFDDVVALLLGEPPAKIDTAALAAADFKSSTQGKNVKLKFTVPYGITDSDFYQVYRTESSLSIEADPGDEMALVFEASPTAAEIKAGVVELDDTTPDDFRGASLYTNATQEGIVQANEPPPFAEDVAEFKNMGFYANTKTLQRLELSMLSTIGLNGKILTINGVAFTFDSTENAAIGQVKTFDATTASTLSPAQQVDATARSLVRVINRYMSNTQINAFYISNPEDVPGQLLLEARFLDVGQFSAILNDLTVGKANFNPTIDAALPSDNEPKINRVFYSKLQRLEAVPLVNFFDVGSGNKRILRIIPLRDSLFILKEDGVFRITGDSPQNLSLSLFDSSTKLVAQDTAVVGSNQIFCYSTEGIVQISDAGAAQINKVIEDQTTEQIGFPNVNKTAFAVYYQTDSKFVLWLPLEETDTVARRAFVYSTTTQAWTTWDLSKTCGIVDSNTDKLLLGASDVNFVEVERKSLDRTDFADREFSRLILDYDSVNKIARLDSLINIAVGDKFVQTRTETVGTTVYNYEVEAVVTQIVSTDNNQIRLDTVYDFVIAAATHFKSYEVNVTWAPDMAGDPGVLKQYREATIRFKKSRISTPVLGFSSDIQRGKDEIELSGPGLGTWGTFPWGGVPWGGDSQQRGFRTYVPRGKQRCSLLNVSFRHKVAMEEWQIEGVTLTLEQLSTRINK